MTQPMTPREKVASCYECGSTERIGTASAPCNPELTALASGSGDPDLQKMQFGEGDHAELAAFLAAVRGRGLIRQEGHTLDPSALEALIAENAALRAEIEEARTIDSGLWKWLGQRDLQPDGPDVEWSDIVVALTEHETNAYDIADKATDRATEAERKLAEARTIIDEGLYARTDKFEAMARPFLSSTEAERG